MSGTRRRSTGGDPNGPLILCGVFVIGLVVFGPWALAWVGAALTGTDRPTENPIRHAISLYSGRAAWSTAATIGAVVVGAVLVVVVVVVLLIARRRRHGRQTRVDRAASLMGRGRDIEALLTKGTRSTAQRLGVTDAIGLPIAITTSGNSMLYQGWEDVSIDIWGPRAGKTSARAIPAITHAPGACVVTSNKRDIVDGTRGPRSAKGKVWVLDPQQICGEDPSWWWNPLSYVTDEVQAVHLARVFAQSNRLRDARTDAFFDSAAENLLSCLLLAAACDRRPLTDVYVWIQNPQNDDGVRILDEHGYDLQARTLEGHINAPDRQRGGVYATAANAVGFMQNRAAMKWCAASGWGRPQFDVDAFVRSSETIYLISKEGRGSAGPLVTALTAALSEAAERLAEANGGRCPVPLVIVLDEAANVCRWPDLPDLYSHFGSRSIPVLTFLQSWSQGVEVWGEKGMKKLWGAATVRVVGSGIDDTEFLGQISNNIGEFDAPHTSRSRAPRQGTSYSHSTQRERIMEVAELASLPRGRCIVMGAGSRPSLCTTRPWWQDKALATLVRESFDAYEPEASVVPHEQ